MLYSILTFTPAIVAFFWLIVLIIESNQDLAKRYLAVFMSLSVINYSVHGFYFNHLYTWFAAFDHVWVFTSLAGFPLYYYYIRLLTKDVSVQWRWSLVLIPALALALFSFTVYALMDAQAKDAFIYGVMYERPGYATGASRLVELLRIKLVFLKVIFAVQLLLAVWFGFRLIRDYNERLKHFYSNIGGKDLSQVRWLLFSFVFAAAVSLTSNLVGKAYFVEHPEWLPIPAFAHSVFLFAIGYFGSKQNFTIRHFTADLLANERKTGIKENDSKEISPGVCPERHLRGQLMYEKLSKEMQESHLFTNPDIRITDICLLLGSNRTYISQMINDHTGTNFCDYINTHRVEYAKRLLIEAPELSLEDVAEQSGFSGKSSFYRAFTEKMNLSPGRFRRLVLSNKPITS